MSSGRPYQILDWDSAFFGLRIARVTAGRLNEAAVPEILTQAKEDPVECLYLLVQASDSETVRMAEQHGFHLTDIRVTLEMELSEARESQAVNGIRPASASDIPALREIAGSNHEDSRFFFDPHFPREVCRELYRVWIEKSCTGYADLVLVAEDQQQPVGYLSCHLGENQGGQIGLLGIAAEARGKGLGRRLVTAALQWFASRGVTRVSVVTQGRNIRAQQLYQKAGFVTKSLELWYHAWLADVARHNG